MSRRALVVANDRYVDDGLPKLYAPVRDAQLLRDQLRDPEIGGFEPADLLENESKAEIERAIERLFVNAEPGDLVLLYFSGHGVRSRSGRLHLAVGNTDTDLINATAISASFIKELIEESDAASTVILLDCCYSGAFTDRSFKAQPGVNVGQELRAGSGVYVVTASNAIESALDGDPALGGRPGGLSAFTEAVVRGLSTGAADVRGTGRITPSDLWEYVRTEMPKRTARQTPTQYGYFEEEPQLAGVRQSFPAAVGPRPSRVHLGDLLGPVSPTPDNGLRAEEWQGAGRLIVPIGQSFRGAERAEPVWLDLGWHDGNLLVVGKFNSGKSTLLRTLITALALTHGPDEVVVYCLESGGNRLGSLRRLPSFAGAAGDDQPQQVTALLDEIQRQVLRRKAMFRDHDIDSLSRFRAVRHQLPDGPHADIVLLVDRYADFAQRGDFADRINALMNSGLEYGVHVVLTARGWSDLPTPLMELAASHVELSLVDPSESRVDVRLAEQLPADRPGWALHRGRRFRVALPDLRSAIAELPDVLDAVSDGAQELVDRFTQSWPGSTARPPDLRVPLSAPTDILALLGITDADRVRLPVLWRDWGRRLRVPIGIDSTGARVELDLKEAAQDGMGPHLLLVGTVGSGKTELLRTLLTALALTHPPDAVNMLLVDFRGGASFGALGALPHVAGTATNLGDDAALIDRLTEAIAGELQRRQQMLRQAGSFASVRDYEQARSLGADLTALPDLIIVCEDFTELLTVRPDFIDTLVQVGRVGRSLGVHLVLAAQRLEEGRLRGLDTHLSCRIALRTSSTLESRVVLGGPEAAELPRSPGHGYLRFGTDLAVRFKAATSYELHQPDVASQEPAVSIAEAVAGSLAESQPRARQVWLPPLDGSPTLDQLLGDLRREDAGLVVADEQLRGSLNVPIGLIDLPFEQRRGRLRLQLDGSTGHLAVVGGPRTGKSSTVLTIVTALALTHTPTQLHVYVLDFGDGQLSTLRDLPHVGGTAGRRDVATVRRTVAQMSALLVEREARLAEAGVGTVVELRARGDLAIPDVVLVVDGWATLRGEYEGLEETVTDLVVRGPSSGIHVIATATQWRELRPTVRDLFGSRIELRLADPYESLISRGAAAAIPPDAPGRGIIDGRSTRSAHHVQVGEPRLASGDAGDLVKAIAEAWTGPVAPEVRLLPTEVWYEAIEDDRDPNPLALPIGIAEADLRPVRVDFAADPHFLLFGDSESGKSTFLRGLATTITRRLLPAQARILLVDYRRSLLGTVTTEHLIGYGTSAGTTQTMIDEVAVVMRERLPRPDVTAEQLRNRSWWTGPELFVLVDDYDLVATGHTNPLNPLLEFLPQARDVGLHLVVTRRSGGASRALFEPVLQRLRELGSAGLVLSGDREEGVLLGTVRPSAMPPGRGWLVTRREGVRLIQIVDLPVPS